MLLSELVETSARVTETSGRLKKIELLATCLRQMAADERAIGARYLAGQVPQKTGIGTRRSPRYRGRRRPRSRRG